MKQVLPCLLLLVICLYLFSTKDAFWGPLYFKMERVHKEGSSHPRCSDYLLVSVFLFLNLFVQLAIALQLDDVARESTRDLGHHLLKSACWRVSDHQDLQGVLYPSDMDVSAAVSLRFANLRLAYPVSGIDLYIEAPNKSK